MNKCKLQYKLFYSKLLMKLTIKKAKVIQECLVIPVTGIFLASVAATVVDIEINKVKQMLISGPICGGHPIRNGKVYFNETY